MGGVILPSTARGAMLALVYCRYHDEWYDEDEQEACGACRYEGWLNEIVEVEDRRAQV